MSYNWEFNIIWVYKAALLKGIILTLELTFLSIIIGSAVGLLLALGRLSKTLPFRIFSIIYIEIFLALPVLVLLIWTYYCLPLLIPKLTLNAFMSAVLVLSISLSAFIAETIRAGIEAIPKGQIEAAKSLGMTTFQTTRRIVLPQAIRSMIPPLLTQYITCLKLSSLASTIAVYELLHTANNLISDTYRPLEIYTVVAIIYLILILPMSYFTRKLEIGRLQKRGDSYKKNNLLTILRWKNQ